jgi:hypothetical protein
VGAQYGYDALVAAKLTGAPVASFECDPQAVEVIRRNLDANPQLGGLIHVEEAFVGAGAGQLRLDDFAERWGAPGFVKIDVEGGEADVLRGAARLLRSTHPSLLVEVHSVDLEQECADLLTQAGYRLSVVNQRRLLRDHRPWAGHNRWLVAV